MHEGGALSWRDVLDNYHSQLVDDLSASFDSELRDAVSKAIAAEHSQRTSQVESLNQILRRLRTVAEDRVLPLLAEGCAAYAGKLVVLVFENNQARSIASSGISAGDFCFDTVQAPAIVSAIDTGELVVALASDNEISPVLAQAFGAGGESAQSTKAYLFPVVARHTVMALLVASGDAVSAQIELLCQAAGMRLEAVTRTLPPTEAVPSGSGAGSWEGLSAEDRSLHLQAQRTARLRVAEMRLYHEKDLKAGVAAADIYTALQEHIDTARRQFLESFLSKSPTMVDYLHLEILRSLAHDDDRLLGRNYPGPMVDHA